MHERIERFRRQVEDHFGGRPGRGARYPEPLRAEAVEITRSELGRGESLGSVARKLGVGAGTLSRWQESPPIEMHELRPVEVVDPQEHASQDRDVGGGLVVVTAAGHRVEGLELAEVARLLEALG